jgi:hypothetical protein
MSSPQPSEAAHGERDHQAGLPQNNWVIGHRVEINVDIPIEAGPSPVYHLGRICCSGQDFSIHLRPRLNTEESAPLETIVQASVSIEPARNLCLTGKYPDAANKYLWSGCTASA